MDLSLLIAAVALCVSLALALREFTARSIPFGYVDTAKRWNAIEWVPLAYRIHVTNLGRRPFVLEGAGVLNPSGDGVSGSQGAVWTGPQGDFTFRQNPECPRTVHPGELVTFVVAPEHRGAESDTFGILIVRRNLWRWLPKQRKAQRLQVSLSRVSYPD
jgi:hypothetical protein